MPTPLVIEFAGFDPNLLEKLIKMVSQPSLRPRSKYAGAAGLSIVARRRVARTLPVRTTAGRYDCLLRASEEGRKQVL